MFPTKRTSLAPVGLAQLREAVSLARSHGVPLVAAGGITLDTAEAIGRIADAAASIDGLMASRTQLRDRAMAMHVALGGHEALAATAPA